MRSVAAATIHLGLPAAAVLNGQGARLVAADGKVVSLSGPVVAGEQLQSGSDGGPTGENAEPTAELVGADLLVNI